MENKPGVLVVMAHPDDESMGCAGLILRHTRAGIPVNLICATRGEAGWSGKPTGAKREDLAQIRTGELDDAAAALAISGVELWDYPDGGVNTRDRQEITQRIWEGISKHHPKAVVGWGPDGGYGHPDHIAIGACTDSAVNAMSEGERPALYHLAIDRERNREPGLSQGDDLSVFQQISDAKAFAAHRSASVEVVLTVGHDGRGEEELGARSRVFGRALCQGCQHPAQITKRTATSPIRHQVLR